MQIQILQVTRAASIIIKRDEHGFLAVGSLVPRLSVKCVQALARFFCHKPDAGRMLKGGDRALFLSMLSTKEAITLTADKIPDEVSRIVHK